MSLASLRLKGEARSPEGCRRETVLTGKSPEREENERSEADMEGHGVVGDRTTEKFRCSESGRSAVRAERMAEVRAFVRAGKRRNGRGAKGGRKVNA
jgi:hypothetical protein